MNLVVYKLTCDPRTVDKSKYITDGLQRTILLKHNPNNIKEFNISTSEDLSAFNYCYIPRYKNYYFISEPTVLNGEIKGYTLTKDVLYTHNAKIKTLKCLVERSESHGNGWLNDANYPISAKNKIITKKFPTEINDDSIILITVG